MNPLRTISLLAVLALACLLLAGCAVGRVQEAVWLLEDIIAGDGPSALKNAGLVPVRRAHSYLVRGRAYGADLYWLETDADWPPSGAGIVLVPGLAPRGKDDPRLAALARSLARVGFLVLVPDIGSFKDVRAGAEDPQAVGDAVLALHREMAAEMPAHRIGVAAISYAVGPAVLATLDAEVRDHVDFVFGVGGYYDLPAVIAFFTTGKYRESPADPWLELTPNAYGKWVFVRNNADQVADADDRRILGEMAWRKLQDLEADISDLVPRLGPEGGAVYALLANSDPERVPALIDALPATVREGIGALDLAQRDLSKLRARLILIHGRDDAIIPWTETRKLAAAAPEGLAEAYIVDNLAHVDLGAGAVWDALSLLGAAYDLLAERDRAAVTD